MAALTSEERALLRSGAHRFRLFFVVWGTWQIQVQTPLLTDPVTGEPTQSTYIRPNDLRPVLNIGSHRLAFVGEPITFDASRSWRRDGTNVTGGTWSFVGGTPASASGVGPHQVSWSAPGLYTVSYSNSGVTATRWVRVYQDRMALPYEVATVGSVTGTVEQGWRMELTVMPNDVTNPAVDLADFQAVGLYCEEEWWDGTAWVRQPIGNYEPEPRLVMSGYIEQGTIQRTAETHAVSFSVGNLTGQLANATVHTMHHWNATFDVPTESAGMIFEGFTKLTTPDIVLWVLQAYTNVLPYHDFTTWYDNSQQNISELSSQEGTLLDALRGWAEAEFAWLFADAGNGLRLIPNPHIRSENRFGELYPFRADLIDADAFSIQVQEDLQRNVVWVQVQGVRIRDGKQFLGRYPGKTPPTGPGTWLVKDRLAIHSQAFADLLAENFYRDANRRYSATITQGLNRAIGVPERIRISIDLPDRGLAWEDKAFLVEQVSYAIDVAAGSWQTTLTAKEIL